MSASKLQSNNLVDNIPTNWNTTLLRFLLKEKITDGPHETPEFVDEGYPFLSVDGIQNGELVFEGCRFISEEAHVEYSKKVKPIKGDLLMGKAASTGKIAQVKVDFEFSIWSPLAWIRPNEIISSDFLELVLKSDYCQAQIEMLCTHSTQNNISMQDIPRIRIHYPPRNDQDNISRYLNEKISKLNTVEEQLNLELKLLKEKRSTLITQAVTKGLNLGIQMKDSGVEWIGQTPETWNVKQIKHACILETGHTPRRSEASYWLEEECVIPWVSLNDSKNLRNGDYITETKIKISEIGMKNSSAHLIEEGAVVFTRDASIGLAAITTVPMAVSQHIIAWICKPEIDNHFLLYLIYAMTDELERRTMGSTLKTIGMDDVKELKIPVPPLDEQKIIIRHLIEKRKMIDVSVSNIIAQLELLSKYRTALISAAVTGKIDVRESV